MRNFSKNSLKILSFRKKKKKKRTRRIIAQLAYQPFLPLSHISAIPNVFTSKQGIEAAAPQRKISPVRFIPSGGQADP